MGTAMTVLLEGEYKGLKWIEWATRKGNTASFTVENIPPEPKPADVETELSRRVEALEAIIKRLRGSSFFEPMFRDKMAEPRIVERWIAVQLCTRKGSGVYRAVPSEYLWECRHDAESDGSTLPGHCIARVLIEEVGE